MAQQDRVNVASTSGAFGRGAAAVVSITLKAAALPERPTNPRLFDELPAPRYARDDAKWWAAREQRERDERAARRAAASGQPGSADLSVFKGR